MTSKTSELGPHTGDWVGVVANRNSGMGGGLRLVKRLARALRRVGLSEQVAWTPEERAVDGQSVRRRPTLPLSGRRGR